MHYSTSESHDQRLRERIRKLCSEKEPFTTGVDPKLSKLEGIRAVYFDVYGTILISGTEPMLRSDQNRELKHLSDSFKAFGLNQNVKIIKWAIDRLHHHVGESHRDKKAKGIDYPEVDIIAIWQNVIEDLKTESKLSSFDNDLVPDLLTDFVTRYDEPWLMPGLETTLNELEVAGKDIGIISNSQFYTPITLEALTGRSVTDLGFEAEKCFWSYSEDIAKPSIEFYERAVSYLNTIGMDSREVLFVGNDMLNDIYPAQKAGFKTALFAGDKRSLRLREDDERCIDLKPDLVITRLSQITDCV